MIDDAGMRGARRGGAQMSEMHSNFLINAGGATAADLEELGEEVRKRVFEDSGLTLEWEIMRVGEPARRSKDNNGPQKARIRGGGGHVEQGSPQSGGTDGWAFRRAGGFACHRARMRRAHCGRRDIDGDGGRCGPRPCRCVLTRSETRRLLQRPAWPLGRGWLRAGHAGMAAASPIRIRACWPRRWRWTRRGRRTPIRAAGLPVVDSRLACTRTRCEARHVMPPPYVVKPNNEGSSVGVYIVREGANAPPPLSDDDARGGDGRGLCAGARTDGHA